MGKVGRGVGRGRESKTKAWVPNRKHIFLAMSLARAHAPCNIFFPKSNYSKLAKSPSSEGIEPVSEFSNR